MLESNIQNDVRQNHLSETHTEMQLRNAIDEVPKRMRSPPSNFKSSFSINPIFINKKFQRMENQRRSPPYVETLSQRGFEPAESRSVGQNARSLNPAKLDYLGGPKRARPLLSIEEPSPSLALVDSEREMQAKVKRLARFSTDLSQPLQNLHDLPRHKSFGNMQNAVNLDQHKADDEDAASTGIFLDHEGVESSKPVMGLCPNMCPESEKEERERKGDLDKYERLNGNRNQTSQFLAVKKYNRTADREAELIRPMPVLHRTVDYLLSLLDQPYDGNFLNIYNFLWDRMRAVRMDLRMQHIFNEDAISMLEQMIRLHVIAMHELCEFEKGKGFTEAFDAHLNIEQMNKTSVELFQMYDDHRMQGKSIASEKEFRGYYALLKLDKHPGYKVEPAELSLDLAKMTSEIRCTPEILFARDVARACRFGNYIAFFRLARKATYLQACLMHAHFSKLRKQALASLHSGLQNNQGVPIAHVEKWLAMEGEDTEGLLEYHGFSLKRYEEAYMVKEGPFLRSNMDLPSKCSQLVQHRRSRKIVDDVRSAVKLEFPVERVCMKNIVETANQRKTVDTETQLNACDEMILESKVTSTPMVLTESEPSNLFEGPLVIPNIECGTIKPKKSVTMATFPAALEDISGYDLQDMDQQMLNRDTELSFNKGTLQVIGSNKCQPTVHLSTSSYMVIENSGSKKSEREKLENEARLTLFNEKETATKEKLKLILRKWKKQASLRRKYRERREFLANSALSSLSLGPPIRQIESQTWFHDNLDIDAIARTRLGNYGNSWSRLKISDLAAPIMVQRNPGARFICWKLVFLVQHGDPDNHAHQLASNWLFSKLMGSGKGYDEDLVVSSTGLSIWKKWIDSHTTPEICCLSVIRRKVLGDREEPGDEDALGGASCLVYLVLENIPWEIQRARFQNFLVSIPPGSKLPLLLLSFDSSIENGAKRSLDIIKRLALDDADQTRICSSSVIFLGESNHLDHLQSFFDDHQLRVGLQWLANNSPSLPSLLLVRTRELVLKYLRRYMEVAENHDGYDVAPDHCIAAFNEALDKSAEEIIVTASLNPTQWPAPEIDLLENSSKEGILARLCCPSTGWSSPTRIDLLVRAMKSCKLPSFPDTSWLNYCLLTGEQIKQQKLAVEEILIRYLTESGILSNADLVTREAYVMLQNGAGLELRGSSYCITLRWTSIFQRIFCWQLNKLTARDISTAYVLDGDDLLLERDAIHGVDVASGVRCSGALKEFPSTNSEGHRPLQTFPAEVSLNELIEISCSNPFEKSPLVSKQTPLRIFGEAGDGAGTSRSIEDPRCCSSSYELPELMETNRQIESPLAPKDERLITLLERCNRVQDTIDLKLAIYY